MACTDTENSPQPGDTENVLLRKLLNRLCNVTSGGGGDGVSQAYVDARDAATLASANANAVAGDVATLAAAMSSASALYVLKSGDTMTGALLLPNGAVGAPSLSHAADANTGLWFPAADTIAFSTAGAERVRFDSAGNVGIGTTAPTLSRGAGLHIYGNVEDEGGSTIRLSDGEVSANGNFEIRSTRSGSVNRFEIGEAASSFLTILSDTGRGNVGIGIVAPLARLHVTPSASGTDYFRIDHSDGTPRLQMGVFAGSTAFGAMWLGNVVPAIGNSILSSDGTGTYLSAPSGILYLGIGGPATPQWKIISTGHFLAETDNTHDIGASGANRPRNYFGAGTVNAAAGLITGNVAALVISSVAMNDGAAAALGTLTNAPAAGNPTKWIPIDDNGTTRYIPAW